MNGDEKIALFMQLTERFKREFRLDKGLERAMTERRTLMSCEPKTEVEELTMMLNRLGERGDGEEGRD